VLVQLELFPPLPVADAVFIAVDKPEFVVVPVLPVAVGVAPDPPTVIAVANQPEYDEFQAETLASTLDGTGAMVAWAEEQPEESADAAPK
jgi:hypothetical protein